MTNTPRFPERTAVTRALNALTNGHGVPHAAPKPRQVATSQEAIALADHFGCLAQIGAAVPIPLPNGVALVQTPDFAAVAASTRKGWDAAQPEWTDDMRDHFALIEAAAAFQQATGAVFARWHARHAAKPAVVADDALPEPPEDRPPMRLLDADDEPPCAT